MGYSNHAREYVKGLKYTPVFTGTVTYAYIKPVKVGVQYYATAKIFKIEGRLRHIRGVIFDQDGNCYVRGEGVFITAPSIEDKDEMVAFQPLTDNDPKEI